MTRPTYIIAEAGVNHNGSLELAKRLAEVAKEAGADAVKYQTFQSEQLVSTHAQKANYQKIDTDPGQNQLDMLRRLELSFEQFSELKNYCGNVGIEFLSTPFDEASADFLFEIGMSKFKIPSGEITNLRLIRHVAAFGRPIILSTGMSTLAEVERAVGWVKTSGFSSEFWLLHCVSAYPAEPKEMNLHAMKTMAREFGLPGGLSDHTLGISVPVAAVALGAVAVEKHFTLDRSMEGPDHAASLEPGELKAMVSAIRTVEVALGDGVKIPAESERDVTTVARRSVVASRDLVEGSILAEIDLELKRPGLGIEPFHLHDLVGRTLNVSIQHDHPIEWRMLD